MIYAVVVLGLASVRLAPAARVDGRGRCGACCSSSGRSCSSCGRIRRCCGSSSSRRSLQLLVLGYAATTDVKNVPIVVGGRRPVGGEPGARSSEFDASRYFTHRGRGRERERDRRRTSSSGRAWMALSIPAGYGAAGRVGRAGDGAGRRRRHRRELDDRRAGLRDDLVAALRAGSAGGAGCRRGRCRRRRHRAAGARLVQPAARSKDFMIPGVLALLLIVMTACSRRWASCARRSWARSSS